MKETIKTTNDTGATNAIEIRALSRVYRGEGESVTVLDALDLKIAKGEIVSVEGASGVGKSTLLNIIGTIDTASSGSVSIYGREVTEMSDREKEDFRSRSLGFIFQHHYLLPDFTVEENVMMPLLIQRMASASAQQQAARVLGSVGLDDRRHHYPNQISGGEMARAGVARALVGEKNLILADEPTGNLDRKNSERLVDLLWKLQKELGFTLIIVTHDRELAEKVPTRYQMLGGKLSCLS